MIFPRIESSNSDFVQVDNSEKLEEKLAIEKEYQYKNPVLENLYSLTFLIALSLPIFPLIIRLKYGKEPEIAYKAVYEREPPTNSKPAVVNAIIKGKNGFPTMDGFTATIMDLVRLDYLSIKPERKLMQSVLKTEYEDIIEDNY